MEMMEAFEKGEEVFKQWMDKQPLSVKHTIDRLLKNPQLLSNAANHLVDTIDGIQYDNKKKNQLQFKREDICGKSTKLIQMLQNSEIQAIRSLKEANAPDERKSF